MLSKLLIANRGEIAIRIARTAAEMGIPSVALFSEDDVHSLHTRVADEANALKGSGPGAYLDAAQILRLAREAQCDAVHPGYGFLSENSAFAEFCEEAGLIFIGPRPETLLLFGDKTRARAHARDCGVPILAGTGGPTSIEQAKAFLASLGNGGTAMVKAVSGGGGRGMRIIRCEEELEEAFARCRAEALQAFGCGDLYMEEFYSRARHIEVQIVGDGKGGVAHIWDRECSLQRQRQKIIEIAPAEGLPSGLRDRLLDSAIELGAKAAYRGLGTVEFLVDTETGDFAFIEANPRLQVEHTVTEEVTGLDLVRVQLEIASGGPMPPVGECRGTAIQVRINLETMTPDGVAEPAAGVIGIYEPPSGPGVRVDGFGYSGYQTALRFDSLLAKLIVHVPIGGFAAAAAKARRALSEFRITGVPTNAKFLQALLCDKVVLAGGSHTRLIEERMSELARAPSDEDRHFGGEDTDFPALPGSGQNVPPPPAAGKAPEGTEALRSPMHGLLVSIVSEGELVRPGQEVALLEAMKMQHPVRALLGGLVRRVIAVPDQTVMQGEALLFIEPAETAAMTEQADQEVDLELIRPDLAAVLERHRVTSDASRPDAVARRRKTGQRTTRENLDDLLDPGSFVEYGALVVAGRSRRNTMEELIDKSPADGLVMGLGTVNAGLFGDEASRVAAMSYDYTVFAGTQGARNHIKTDRMAELAARWGIPLVFFTEGGGGRPGDTDGGGFIRAFELFAKLSGRIPLIGISSGRCFAGNAALLGCCDVVIATENSTIGMGGPAMIEGGGLGVYRPEEVGPASVHTAGGVIDILVTDESEAVDVAKKYLSYFQGPVLNWDCSDQRLLRRLIPEDRLRVYEVRRVIEGLADIGSVLELRRGFGAAMIIALARIEGRPVGIIANNPLHLGGAIDSDAADKAARFMQLCEAFDLPLVMLSDTPGIMVGPEAEKTGLVRHSARMFVIGANLTVPIFSVVLRKSYGLGAIAMTGGSYQASLFSVAWPTGEFGGMGLEGAVKLGYRNELAAIEDPDERKAKFEEMVGRAYEFGKALTTATYFGIDDVIDPADTRRWILAGLRSVPAPQKRREKKLPWIDSW